MRKPRPQPSPERADGWHHLYTRTVNRELFLTEAELTLLKQLSHQVGEYNGGIVCTHTEMGNHLHIEVHIPKRENLSDEEILRRYCALHPNPSPYAQIRIESVKRSLRQTGCLSKRERERHLAQMYNKSRFMQLLKPRFTKLFNKARGRVGPLWNERFRNQAFPDEPGPRLRLSAYIDLNACRAGLCQDPKDYPFCGYAEAVAGDIRARAGLMKALEEEKWEKAHPRYRKFLYEQGSIFREGKARIPQAKVEKVLAQGGQLTGEQIRECQYKYLTHGGAIGSAAFVQSQIDLYRQQTGKGQRLRPIPVPSGIGLDGLYVMSRPRLRHF